MHALAGGHQAIDQPVPAVIRLDRDAHEVFPSWRRAIDDARKVVRQSPIGPHPIGLVGHYDAIVCKPISRAIFQFGFHGQKLISQTHFNPTAAPQWEASQMTISVIRS